MNPQIRRRQMLVPRNGESGRRSFDTELCDCRFVRVRLWIDGDTAKLPIGDPPERE